MLPHRRQPTRLPRPWDSPGKNTGVGCHFLLQCMKVREGRDLGVAFQAPPGSQASSRGQAKDSALLSSRDAGLLEPPERLPGFSVYGIFQARVLEWGAIAFSGILPGDSGGQRNLACYSPWGYKESDTTEAHFHFSLSCIGEGNGNPLQCSCLENPRDGGAW